MTQQDIHKLFDAIDAGEVASYQLRKRCYKILALSYDFRKKLGIEWAVTFTNRIHCDISNHIFGLPKDQVEIAEPHVGSQQVRMVVEDRWGDKHAGYIPYNYLWMSDEELNKEFESEYAIFVERKRVAVAAEETKSLEQKRAEYERLKAEFGDA